MKTRCRRHGFTTWELLVVVVIVAVMAAILWPVTGHHGSRQNARRAACQSNLKQIGLAFMQYSQDYDERMPRLAAFAVSSSTTPFFTPYGWVDALKPYTKTTKVFQCPSEANRKAGTDAVRTGFTDYYFNTNASGVALKYFARPSMTILCGEGNDGKDLTNARYNRKSLPQHWRMDEESPARRHLDTASYLFADGHVKSYKPNVIQNTARPSAGRPTFAIR